MLAYFDTNFIRYLASGLAGRPIEQLAKRKVVLSAVSAIELVSQIPGAPREALSAIHAFENWLDTDHAILLDWSETFVAEHVFHLQPDQGVFELLQQVLQVCYRAREASPRLIEDATRLRDFNEDAKRDLAQLFEQAANAMRAMRLNVAQLRRELPGAIVLGLKVKYGHQAAAVPNASVFEALAAYIEFRTDLAQRAVDNVGFNFQSRDHLNSLWDAEQLCYLARPQLHFFTTDRGFQRVGAQRDRIHVVPVDEVREPARAHGFLTAALE